MARHCIREPRYIPPVHNIGAQPDLFGGPTISHVAERNATPKGWERQLQKWGRCTVMADLDAETETAPVAPVRPSPSPIHLVACVAGKLDHPAPARELYTSPWFQKARAYVERQGGQWFILSAKHGLIGPEEVIEPYDETLARMSAAARRLWGARVIEAMQRQAAQLAYEADAFDYTKIAISATKAVQATPPAGTTLIEAQSTRYAWLTINMLSPRLKDPKVRQAVQYGVDVGQILTGVYDDLAKRSTGVVQPGTQFARPKNIIEAPDYQKSASLLAEAGVSDLTLTLTVMNDSIRTAIAQIIQASLEQAGIKVEIQPYDEAAFWGVGDKTQGDGYKNIDLALMDFAGGVDPSENLVWFRPDQIGAYNWSGFDNPEFEASYQKLVAESDTAKRVALSNRMEDLMEGSGCFVFICHQPLVVIHRNSFEPVIYPDGHPNAVLFKKKA